MSSPQPPDGGQQGQPQGSGEQPGDNPTNTPNSGADSTQMISSRMNPQQGNGGQGDDSTQVVRPAQPPQQPQQPQQGGDSTQVVPPTGQPPQPMYEQPGLSGQQNPGPPPQPYGQPGNQQSPAGGFPAQQPGQAGTPGTGFPAPQAHQGQPAGFPPPQAAPGQPGSMRPGFQPGGPVGQPVEWGTRAVGFLIDYLLPMLPGYILYIIGMINMSIGMLITGWVLLIAAGLFSLWNLCYKQGTTGQSVGKGVAKTKLISEETGQPLGFGQAFLRQLCHAIDALPCYVGFLSPLWDAKNQTWADKIMQTVVVPAEAGPSGPPTGYGPPPQQPGGFGQPGQPPQGGFGPPQQPPQQPPRW